MSDIKSSVMDFFPFDTPRSAQTKVIKAVEKAFQDGSKFVILESPVGSGKSAIAMTLAKLYGESHILTPRKSLQDQYYEDFKEHDMVVMKGRSAYPCLYESLKEGAELLYNRVTKKIKAGEIIRVGKNQISTSSGPCLLPGDRGTKAKKECTLGDIRPCPYHVAIDTAMESAHVVHNLHSFIFQAHFAGRFDIRKMLILDEAHCLPEVIRGFTSKKVKVPRLLGACPEVHPPDDASIDDWCDWFRDARMIPSDEEVKAEYLGMCEALKDTGMKKFIVQVEEDSYTRTTKFTFTPISIGDSPYRLILRYGEKVLLMSGTIYDKNYYCRQIGIDPEQAHFIRVGSSFPIKNRPIYMKKNYMVDTSHRNWSKNLPQLGIRIKKVLDVFNDTKGLIHVPSYNAARELIHQMKDPRLVMHNKEDFQSSLEEFYYSKGNKVFVSPVCQQGVDFKENRARFQIITRIPYLNTGDPFVGYMVKNDFAWYNYQALVVFGQQIGRVNRSESDFGATILMDERFTNFVNRNRHKLPKWVMDAIITGES